MFGQYDKFIAVFFASFTVTFLLTPLVRKLATRYGVVDKPDARRPHKRTTARGGGIAVVIGVYAASLLAMACSWTQMSSNWWLHFIGASSVLAVIGIIDDVRGMRPMVKLSGQALAALLMALTGLRFGSIFSIPIPPVLDYFMVVFYVVAVINAFNLIDGLDGLASGLAIISGTGLCGVLIINHSSSGLIVLLALIGACLAFLRYNFHPATIFLGDTGSMFLGFTLGVVSLQTFNKSTFFLSLTIPILVLGIPIYDAMLAIWRRSVRMWLPLPNTDGTVTKRGIMQPDVEHLHHRLLKLGLSTRRAATSLYILNMGLVAFGLLLASFYSHRAGIFLFAMLVVAFFMMRHLAVTELHDTGAVILTGLHRPSRSAVKALIYPVWDMFWLTGSVAFIMWRIEGVRVDFWHTWFLELPIWVTPTFSLLALSRTYVTVWTRARVLDVLMLLSMLQVGLLSSLAVALLIDPSEASRWFVRALIIGGLCHPMLILARLFYRIVQELVGYFATRASIAADQRVLIYGAGGRCQLFIKERDLNTQAASYGNLIVGLIDDEPLLRYQWVYGYKVLGTGRDLANLITRQRINRIIVTTTLRPESMALLRETVQKLNVEVSEWRFSESSLSMPAPEALPVVTP